MSELYKSMGRSWIKLWVPEWLDGTSRYEMSGGQRAFWVDLLTLAGRSRIPGVVCAGEDPNNLFGYPLDRYAGILGDGSVDILETFKLFESQGKIEIVVTREESPRLYAIRILSWAKYQSEYMRQRAYRAKVRPKTRRGASKVTPKNTPRLPVEGEGEGDGEKREKNKIQPASLAASEFRLFWDAFPKKIGEQRAREAWQKSGCEGRLGEILAGLKDWRKVWSDPQFIPHAHRWLSEGLWKENPHVAMRKESLHDQLAKLGAKA